MDEWEPQCDGLSTPPNELVSPTTPPTLSSNKSPSAKENESLLKSEPQTLISRLDSLAMPPPTIPSTPTLHRQISLPECQWDFQHTQHQQYLSHYNETSFQECSWSWQARRLNSSLPSASHSIEAQGRVRIEQKR
ncbi:unnamed protein product, partial [Mesorhabditis belari]|uniref:Uncharacterized protein n=1 Tax=Mesorhabditis belari TaxID=2138241 RepID=A0AAF3FIQ3_9BILA